MAIVSLSLLVALVVSMIANVALVMQLRAVTMREKEMKHERKW